MTVEIIATVAARTMTSATRRGALMRGKALSSAAGLVGESTIFAVDRLMAVPAFAARSVSAASRPEVLAWPRGVTGSP